MYLHIGRNQMLAERRIIGIFDLEITSQSKTTRAFLDRAHIGIVHKCGGNHNFLTHTVRVA